VDQASCRTGQMMKEHITGEIGASTRPQEQEQIQQEDVKQKRSGDAPDTDLNTRPQEQMQQEDGKQERGMYRILVWQNSASRVWCKYRAGYLIRSDN
jgi:hypothetical protein